MVININEHDLVKLITLRIRLENL